MRVIVFLACAAIAACASQPAAPPPASAAGAAAPAASADEVERTRVAEAIKRGYKVVNTNGEILYCRSDWATGSHIQKNTVCLTGQQLDDIHERNDQMLDQPDRSRSNKFTP